MFETTRAVSSDCMNGEVPEHPGDTKCSRTEQWARIFHAISPIEDILRAFGLVAPVGRIEY